MLAFKNPLLIKSGLSLLICFIIAIITTYGYVSAATTDWSENSCLNSSIPSLQAIKNQINYFQGIMHPANCTTLGLTIVRQEISTKGIVAVFEGNNTPPEQDRYEVIFNKNIGEIYGLGGQFDTAMQSEIREDVNMTTPNGDKIKEFRDLNFSGGHQNFDYLSTGNGFSSGYNGYSYHGDIVSTRTPIVIFPKEKLLIAYYQPAVKQVRITTNQTQNTTTVVFKKNADYDAEDYAPYLEYGNQPGKLIIVKGATIDDMYSLYKNLLSTDNGAIKSVGSSHFYYKKPHPKAFGVGWETWGSFGGYPEPTRVLDIYNRIKSDGLALSTLTIGSGYWKVDDPDYYDHTGGLARMEILQPAPIWENIKQFQTELQNDGVYPLLGMRHNVYYEYKDDFLSALNASSVIKSKYFYSDYISDGFQLSKNSYFINPLDSEVIGNYIDNLQSAYGDFKGIKEDEMYHFDEIGLRKQIELHQYDTLNNNARFIDAYANGTDHNKSPADSYYIDTNDGKVVKNTPELVFHDLFANWSKKTGGDTILWSTKKAGQFSFPVDIISTINGNYIKQNGFYTFKAQIDGLITRVVSGYPHVTIPDVLPGFSTYEYGKITINPITETVAKEYLSLIKLKAFMPATTFSYGYWLLPSQFENYAQSAQFYLKLAERLHSYKYSLAMRWYETGSPMAIRPLFFNYPNDQNSYDMYKRFDTATKIKNNVVNEFMMGDDMLIAPIFFDPQTNGDKIQVYLPEGEWVCFMKNCQVHGGRIEETNTNYPDTIPGGAFYYYMVSNGNLYDYPIFLKAGRLISIGNNDNTELLIFGVPSSSGDRSQIYYHYPIPTDLKNYESQEIKKYQLQMVASGNDYILEIKNLDGNIVNRITMKKHEYGKRIWVADISTLQYEPIRSDGCPNFSQGNGNCDAAGQINLVDFACLRYELINNDVAPSCHSTDFNNDGKVSLFDFVIWRTNFLK